MENIFRSIGNISNRSFYAYFTNHRYSLPNRLSCSILHVELSSNLYAPLPALTRHYDFPTRGYCNVRGATLFNIPSSFSFLFFSRIFESVLANFRFFFFETKNRRSSIEHWPNFPYVLRKRGGGKG